MLGSLDNHSSAASATEEVPWIFCALNFESA